VLGGEFETGELGGGELERRREFGGGELESRLEMLGA
jgi:hypothetical protein